MSARLRLGTLELSHDERRVWKDEVAVPIGSRAFDVLSVLVEHRHEVVSKDRLLAHAWPSRIVEENNLTVQISALRRALGCELIATVPGRGYKLTADVVPIERAGMPRPNGTDASAAHLRLPENASVAALPFTNLSGDSESDCFVEGIVEDVMTELSRFNGLFVIGKNRSFSGGSGDLPTGTPTAEPCVQYVLQGSMRRAGSRVRVAAQLVDASTGRQIWGERYDCVTNDMFKVQDAFTKAIVGAIAPNSGSVGQPHTSAASRGAVMCI